MPEEFLLLLDDCLWQNDSSIYIVTDDVDLDLAEACNEAHQ